MPPCLPFPDAFPRRVLAWVLFGLALPLIVWLNPVSALDFDRLQQSLSQRFGVSATQVFKDWQKTLASSRGLGENDKLKRVNDFFNSHIQFADDSIIWRQADYWATPLETMGRGMGDCEDFSIAKYYSLINLGVPINKLRLVYVKATQQGPHGPVVQAHMVLAYYPAPTADPLVLDNLNPQIKPASSRGDLAPIFSFNSEGLWQGTGNQAGKSSLSRWQDLLQRARAEGF